MMTIDSNDTICALATPAGGAIGIIRVSGNDAIRFTDRIFHSEGKPLAEARSQTIHYGDITDGDGNVVDDVLVAVFRAPHSYTGENSTEISCHGSRYVIGKILELLISAGCRQAEPGEYTRRAFMNGKMDLSQAEAVADLIASTNRATHRIAVGQLRGSLSSELSKLRGKLLEMTSLLELELDFSDQDVNFADRRQLLDLAELIDTRILSLAKSFETGRAIKHGIPVAIIGKTNVGKSTLLNRLIGEEKAIVSNIHGTTRDVIEDIMDINGITFRFIDTAGIRLTSDEIERLGIERTYKKMDEAVIILWVIDAPISEDEICEMGKYVDGKKLIVVRNKIDAVASQNSIASQADTDGNANQSDNITHTGTSMIQECSSPTPPESLIRYKNENSAASKAFSDALYIEISAKQNINIKALENAIYQAADIPEQNENSVIVTNARHYDALLRAHKAIALVIQGLQQNISGDLLSEDLRICISHLGDIVGGFIATEETLQSIFRNFCVGK